MINMDQTTTVKDLEPVKIFLGGKLGKLFGSEWKLFVKSPAEAIRAINANTKGAFLRYVEKQGLEKYYKVSVNTTRNRLDSNELTQEREMESLYISPVIKGRGAVARIIIGVVLVIVGAFTSLFGGTALVVVGLGLIVGGVIQLLTPIPTPPRDKSDTQVATSKLLGTPNSVSQGSALPIVYGRGIVPSRPISISSNSFDTVTYSPEIPAEYGGVSYGGQS